METQIFHHAQIQIFTNLSKRNPNPSTCTNTIFTNLSKRNPNPSTCTNTIFTNLSKRNPNPSRYQNSITTNLKFQHKPKISSFKNKILIYIKTDLLLLLLPRSQNPFSQLLYSIMNLNTRSFVCLDRQEGQHKFV